MHLNTHFEKKLNVMIRRKLLAWNIQSNLPESSSTIKSRIQEESGKKVFYLIPIKILNIIIIYYITVNIIYNQIPSEDCIASNPSNETVN